MKKLGNRHEILVTVSLVPRLTILRQSNEDVGSVALVILATSIPIYIAALNTLPESICTTSLAARHPKLSIPLSRKCRLFNGSV